MTEHCGICKFFSRYHYNHKQRPDCCMRHSPMVMQGEGYGLAAPSAYPETDLWDWCGDFVLTEDYCSYMNLEVKFPCCANCTFGENVPTKDDPFNVDCVLFDQKPFASLQFPYEGCCGSYGQKTTEGAV